MTSRFKTFLKFLVLAVFIYTASFFIGQSGGDSGLIFWTGSTIFLGLIWYEISYVYSKNNDSTQAVFSSHRQAISSIIISFTIFYFFFYGFFYVENIPHVSSLISDLFDKYPFLRDGLLFAPEALLILTIALWIWAITHSIQVRKDNLARKSAEKKVIILAIIIGILLYLGLAIGLANIPGLPGGM